MPMSQKREKMRRRIARMNYERRLAYWHRWEPPAVEDLLTLELAKAASKTPGINSLKVVEE